MNLNNLLTSTMQKHDYWRNLNSAFAKWQELAKQPTVANSAQLVQELSTVVGELHKRLIMGGDASLDFLIKLTPMTQQQLTFEFTKLFTELSAKDVVPENVQVQELCNLALNLIDAQAEGYLEMTKGLLASNMHKIKASLLKGAV